MPHLPSSLFLFHSEMPMLSGFVLVSLPGRYLWLNSSVLQLHRFQPSSLLPERPRRSPEGGRACRLQHARLSPGSPSGSSYPALTGRAPVSQGDLQHRWLSWLGSGLSTACPSVCSGGTKESILLAWRAAGNSSVSVRACSYGFPTV